MKQTHPFVFLALVGVAAFPACSSSNKAAGGTDGGGGGDTSGGGDTAGPNITSHNMPYPTIGSIQAVAGKEAALNAVVAMDSKLEKLAEGFTWSEGPLWVPSKSMLLFTDVPQDTIYKWEEGKGVSVWMKPAGCFSAECRTLPEPGANGLMMDKSGALIMCQHGERRLAKLANFDNPTAAQTVVADKYMGKRFNSPNDLVQHSRGDIFFTDPPYGLGTQNTEDPKKEITFQGVYRIDTAGMIHVVSETMERPNGIALSPDQTKLYVANSHGPNPIWMEFTLDANLQKTAEKVLFDATQWIASSKTEGGNDGIAIDTMGNIFATGPGGVLILDPAGNHLGTIMTTQKTANAKFGGADNKTLYVTAGPFLTRIRTVNAGLKL
jgi:gluconolactonase